MNPKEKAVELVEKPKESVSYWVGMDIPVKGGSKASMVIFKQHGNLVEIVKVMRYRKWRWFNRFRYKYAVWKICRKWHRGGLIEKYNPSSLDFFSHRFSRH